MLEVRASLAHCRAFRRRLCKVIARGCADKLRSPVSPGNVFRKLWAIGTTDADFLVRVGKTCLGDRRCDTRVATKGKSTICSAYCPPFTAMAITNHWGWTAQVTETKRRRHGV